MLQGIDTTALRSRGIKARFSLLNAIALEKNTIHSTDAGILQPAIRYYSRFGNADERLKAYYYYGRILENAKNYPEAVVAFQRALDESAKSRDAKMKGMVCAAMGRVHNRNYNITDELKYTRLALDQAEESGDSVNMPRYLNALALAYHNSRDFDKADSLFAVVTTYDGCPKSAFVLRAENEIMRPDGNPDRALSLFEDAIANGSKLTYENWYEYAYSLVASGEKDKGLDVFRRLSAMPRKFRSDYWQYMIFKAVGQTEEALHKLEDHMNESDSTIQSMLAQSTYKIQATYYSANSELSKNQKDKVKLIMLLMLFAIITIGLIIFFVVRERRIIIMKENEQLIIQQEETRNLLADAMEANEEAKSRYDALRKSFARMYQSQFSEIGSILEKRGSIESLSISAKKQAELQINSILQQIAGPSRKQREFEKRIDRDLDGIITKLRTDYPDFDDADIRLLSLYIIGFDATTISFILNKDSHYIRTLKSRLKRRINAAESPNLDLYNTFIR